MVTTDDGDLRGELAALVGALRAQVAWHARGGVFAAKATGASPDMASPGVAESPFALSEAPEAPSRRAPRLTLAEIRTELGDCQRCKLAPTRNKIVFGNGSETAPLVFVGEAPGADEDRIGDPFVGRAGELLDKMIEAMGWTRATVWVGNTLKCRPPNNRNPEPDETAACQPFLFKQIESIAPRVIVTLGRPAANLLLANNAPISALRGRFHEFRGVRLMPTFHPAYLLREPGKKRDAWNDLKLVMAELDRLGIKPPNPPRG